MNSDLLQLHPDDDVAVLKREVDGIPAGHKVALHDIVAGSPVRKYGQIIGFATAAIPRGAHVHSHNLGVKEFARDYAFGADARPVVTAAQFVNFDGYTRPDGRVGTRNYIAVISSVNCSASVSKFVAAQFADVRREYPNVDGVIALTHKSGCCIQPGDPARLLQRSIAGMAVHPNVAGTVMIGLGCETNQLQLLVRDFQLRAPVTMEIQQAGGVRRTVEAGVSAVRELLPRVNAERRTRQPASKLALAMNCGGSDGNSGITANPALGVASDLLVRQGGISVLAETPEIYGAEHLLTRRAASRAVGEKLVEIIHWWERHVALFGASIDNNPTFGNKVGGLTTIYEKSLGAVAKGGQSPLAAVYGYAEPVTTPGLCFMDTPGLDPVSMTGLIAGGCNIGAFTTGRGSVSGWKPSPCLKIATNTLMFRHLEEDMDINAGTILDGTETVAQVGQRIFDKLLAVASGEPTKSETQGLGDEEFAPWILGPTL
jgi:altronate hydrolase